MAAAARRPDPVAEAAGKAPVQSPKPRSVDAMVPLLRLKNKEDGYKYVIVSQVGHGPNSVGYYQSMGYEVCITPDLKREPHATVFVSGCDSKPGEPMAQMGLICMRIRTEQAEEIERDGAWGTGGQAQADMIELQLANQAEARGEVERSRGGREGYFGIQNLGRKAMPLNQDEALGDVRLGGGEG